MNRTFALAVALALVGIVPSAFAQAYSPYGVYGGGWGGGGHASTAAEGYANGVGNVMQSAGSYNLQTSQAAINMEQARSMDLDNNLKGTENYFEMRKINTAARKAEEGPGLTTEDSWRIAQSNLPKRMTPVELDPVTGKIYWPMTLQAPQFERFRKQLDSLFVQRESAHGGIGYDTYMQIQDTTTAFLADLKKTINDYKAGDYVKMKNFIESLAFEARFPAV
jgi:hypothetical protein